MRGWAGFVAAVACIVACGGAPAPITPQVQTIPVASASVDGADAAPPVDPAAWSDADSPIPVTKEDPTWGDRSAPVTLVVFGDFQDPYYSRAAAVDAQIKKEYGADRVRFVYKNLPGAWHANAEPAALAAMAVFTLAGADAFWSFHDRALANREGLTSENFALWAADVGIDATRFTERVGESGVLGKVQKDIRLAKELNVIASPAYCINGACTSGTKPIDTLRKTVDQELEKARAKLASGTRADRLYVELSKEGFAKVPPPPEEVPDTTVYKIPLGASPQLGPRTALVTIVEFADFQCPYCLRVQATLKALRARYGDELRIVWKDEPLPFHPKAWPAATLAREARAQKGDKGFWEASEKLYASQQRLPEDHALDDIATALGLDLTKVQQAIAKDKYKTLIEADTDLADDFQASGTPHFFINGRRLVGAQPEEKFAALIDAELAKARALVAKGTRREDVYDATVRDGRGPQAAEKKAPPPVPAGIPFRGARNAKVTVQMFGDYECPFTRRVVETFDNLVKDYGTRVKFVWRDLPLPMHPNAMLFAQAAREARRERGDRGFWEMHDQIFAKQPGLDRAGLDGIASAMNLDPNKFATALGNMTDKSAIDADAQAAKDAGASGTPSCFINGYFVAGAQSYHRFKRAIDAALAEAK